MKYSPFAVLCTLILALSSAHADENSVLFRISCQPEIPAFEIFRLDYQNIGHVLWPPADTEGEFRPNHFRALERLEREFSLYRLYDNEDAYRTAKLDFTCGYLYAVIAFHPGFDGSQLRTTPPFPRMDPELTVSAEGSLVLGPIKIFPYYGVVKSIRTYGQDDRIPVVEICGEFKCGVRSALLRHEFETVTSEDVKEWLYTGMP